MASSITLFADIAVDLVAGELGNRLFTYHVPEHLRDEVNVGMPVLVPFGHQGPIAGYVVSLTDSSSIKDTSLPAGLKTKPIIEVFASEPLFDEDYIEFLYWLAQHYATSISEVLAAALPSQVSPRLKKLVKLAYQGNIAHLQEDESSVLGILQTAKHNTLAFNVLQQKSQLKAKQFHSCVSKLKQEQKIIIVTTTTAATQPKLAYEVSWTGKSPNTARQKEIIACLKKNDGKMPFAQLLRETGSTNLTIKRMCSAGILHLRQERLLRDPLKHLYAVQVPRIQELAASIPVLTADQQTALAVLENDLLARFAAKMDPPDNIDTPWLLHGITGSGKTEIYLRLIKTALDLGKTAMLLVPEISLTPQLAEQLVLRFGKQVAVWHSGLSAGEKCDAWYRLRTGTARVLLGARSAILINVTDLGLIILDEEHDGSYKQSNPSPRYHAKHVAVERSKRTCAMVVLGSATPDVGSYYHCKRQNKVLDLPKRVFNQGLPKSILVDMRQDFAKGNRGIFSFRLEEALRGCLAASEQAILLINRRGFASHIFCRICGHVVKCRNCSVSLVFHRKPGSPSLEKGMTAGYLICHHCGYVKAGTEICSMCKSPFVCQLGLGTQKVEQETKALFPEARILRLDSDVITHKGAYEEVFRKFANYGADILIGTQMVAKGLDVDRVTLVGVLAADAAFNLPDYRSLERGFQLLTQVAGRAGRGQKPGEVILQTYNVDLPALHLACKQEYAAFAEQELAAREAFEYPPFSQLIRVILAGDNVHDVQVACEKLAEELSHYLEDMVPVNLVKILGPAPCILERLRGKFRYHFILKNLTGEKGHKLIMNFLSTKRKLIKLNMVVDIDAVDLL